MEHSIKITTFDEGLLIKITGELDSFKVMTYREKINCAIIKNNPHFLLFDLKSLSFLDSAGIGLLLGRYNEMKRRGGVVGLMGLNSYSAKLVELTGLSKVIKEYKNITAFKKEEKVSL